MPRTNTVTLARTDLQFPPYKTLTPSVEDYMNKVKRGYWKLPYIQRNDTTWPEDHYRELIESIFNNILTSPFIGSQKSPLDISILDGGHRTEAIRRFFDGELRITCPHTKRELLYNELSEETRAEFNDKPLICLVYEGLTPLHEETLFFRVNNSLPLHPGEIINGFNTIPLCLLSRTLGERYADELRMAFKQSISTEDLRGESSNVMMLILRNFHRGHVEVGERSTQKKTVKDLCERLRHEEINQPMLTQDVDALFEIIRNRKREKYEFHIIPTIQSIMIRYDIGSRALTWNNNMHPYERIEAFAELISDFFYEIENPELTPIQNPKYQSLMRVPHDPTIKGVQNPGNPSNCNKRAAIFTEWLEFKGIDISGLIIR